LRKTYSCFIINFYNIKLLVLKEIKLRDEAELESILKKQPSLIEKGLKIIVSQLITSSGRIDMLAVDSDGVLTLVELKVKEDSYQLIQTLNYYDWILNNIDFVKNAFEERLSKYGIQVKDEAPHIILIAPNFDTELITHAKYLNEDVIVKLLKFRSLLVNNQKEILFEKQEIPDYTIIQEKPKTIDAIFEYISEKKLKNSFKKFFEIYETLSGEEPTAGKRNIIIFSKGGRKFAELWAGKDHYWIGLKDPKCAPDCWWLKIENGKLDLSTIKKQTQKAIKLVGGNFDEKVFDIVF